MPTTTRIVLRVGLSSHAVNAQHNVYEDEVGWDGAFPSLHPALTSTQPMPQNLPGLLLVSNYQSIFDSALESYEKKTGKDLTSNPLFRKIEACNSPDDVITLLREQISGFDRSRSGSDSERLTKWLDPTVNVINSFSGTIGDSVSLVGPRIFDLVTRPESGL